MVRRKMGSVQREVLAMLHTHGPWKRTSLSRWVWGSMWDTERVMKTLVRRGDVYIDRAGFYRPKNDVA